MKAVYKYWTAGARGYTTKVAPYDKTIHEHLHLNLGAFYEGREAAISAIPLGCCPYRDYDHMVEGRVRSARYAAYVSWGRGWLSEFERRKEEYIDALVLRADGGCL